MSDRGVRKTFSCACAGRRLMASRFCPNCDFLTATIAADRPIIRAGAPRRVAPISHGHFGHPVRLVQVAVLKSYLMAIAVFCNEVKGKSMLALSRDLDVQYKTAFVLAHKLREAMASSMKAQRMGGEGRTAEIDGAYFGGHVRPENLAADRD